MKILADSNLLLLDTDLPKGVNLERVDGRKIEAKHLQDVDALLVRSVTRIDSALLKGSGVKFVGSATSGIDHMDTDYLHSQGIEYCAAPGSNADAVVDYCLAAIAFAVENLSLDPESLSVGIVGAGNVGGRLAKRLADLNCSLTICDPPLQISGVAEVASCALRPLESIRDCQVVSLHVPLTSKGPYATRDFINTAFLSALPDHCLLINTCRGEVIEAEGLRSLLARPDLNTVIDVWRNEPDVASGLVQAATVATPHIAGYSEMAKRNGVTQVLAQLVRFSVEQGLLPAVPVPQTAQGSLMKVRPTEIDTEANIWQSILQALPIHHISAEFKQLVETRTAKEGFDLMRRSMQDRKEFSQLGISSKQLTSEKLSQYLALGFHCLR